MSIWSKLRIRASLQSVRRRIWPPEPKPLILMYHRIAEEPVDNWNLCVSPSHFEEHLQMLRRRRHPLPLNEFVSRLVEGRLPANAVALTFDDGYHDNLVVGKPLLEAADIPATVFLATGFLNQPGEMWHDELAKLILIGDGPQEFDLAIGGKSLRFNRGSKVYAYGGEAKLRKITSSQRKATLMAVWEVFRDITADARRAAMVHLRSIFEIKNYTPPPGRAMTSQEIRELINSGLITIGAHSVTHPLLPTLDQAACTREIVDSKLACEALTGAQVDGFAYPYGILNEQARAIVRTAGFTFACSNQYGPTQAKSDILGLPRIQITDMHGGAFERTLRYASTLD